MSGVLYIVATPIGNLEDITLRAVRVLRESGRIACEDTRQTRKLLQHLGIDKPLLSCHEHNEAGRTAEILELLRRGESVALVSDAGTPLVSDPGYRLVTAALDANLSVVPVPGATAFVAALSAAGLPTDAFYFGGFLPAKSAQRRRTLEAVKDLPATLVFYDTPHRVLESLKDLGEVYGPRKLVLARELTKIHEEFLRGTPDEIHRILAPRAAIKGEITLLIDRVPAGERQDADLNLAEAVTEAENRGLSHMDAIKAVARERGIPKRRVYQAVVEKGLL